MDTSKQLQLGTQPPHLKNWLKETTTFLEMYNRETSLINLLQNEKASLMAEKEELAKALKNQEEKHKIAYLVLCKDKDDVTKQLEGRVRKVRAELEGRVKEAKEKEILAKELEDNMMKERSFLEEEIKGLREQFLQSNSENVKLHAKFKTMAEMLKKYKTFHEQLNSALKNIT